MNRLVEPAFLCGIPNPYYSSSHVELQKSLREFLNLNVLPFVNDWTESKSYPHHIHRELYRLGAQQSIFRVREEFGGPKEGTRDSFHELIVWLELSRVSLNSVTFMLGIDSMAVPPISRYGSESMRRQILPLVVRGEAHVALAISEGTAGSDVANIRATATRTQDGDYYIINGQKKWISGADVCDFLTCVVRTNENVGGKGISIIVVPKNTPGLVVRPMKMQFDSVMCTCIVNFENVRVPVHNLLGKENDGMKIVLSNFSHERFVIAVSATASARRCLELAANHALKRKTFGKALIEHQVIRFKLAEMARWVEAMQAQIENAAYVLDHYDAENESQSKALGEICALTKVNCTKGFEYCAREASQIFGGAALVRDGIGKEIEGYYRNVRAHAIPGGSEEILLDLAIKSAFNVRTSRL